MKRPGGEPNIGTAAVGVKAAQIGDLEVASDQKGKLGWINVSEILALLYDLGQPKADASQAPESEEGYSQEELERLSAEWDARRAR